MTRYIDGAEANGEAEASAVVPNGPKTGVRVPVRTFAELGEVHRTLCPNADSITVQGAFVPGGIVAVAVQSFNAEPRPTWKIDGRRRFKVYGVGMNGAEAVVMFGAIKEQAAA